MEAIERMAALCMKDEEEEGDDDDEELEDEDDLMVRRGLSPGGDLWSLGLRSSLSPAPKKGLFCPGLSLTDLPVLHRLSCRRCWATGKGVQTRRRLSPRYDATFSSVSAVPVPDLALFSLLCRFAPFTGEKT